MANLVYSAITSLDGYINDEDGNFDWGAPDDEVLQFINDMERGVGTYLFGRRLYETMVYWETFEGTDDDPLERDFAELWRAAHKIVYSTTLDEVSSARTTLKHVFVPDEVQDMKRRSDNDLSIGGPHLASQAIEANLVDELHLYVTPVTLGGGTPAHPALARSELTLLEVNPFASGVVHLKYRLNH